MNVADLIDEHQAVIHQLACSVEQIELAARHMVETLGKGGQILFMGNGGSAADCQHLAAELVGRFVRERRGLPAIALTTDTSILTAIANDYSFEAIFARQVDALCQQSDVVVCISTSGNSRNVVCGAQHAKGIGATVVALTGANGGELKGLANIAITVPSRVVARIQEAHILIGHLWCQWIEDSLIRRGNNV
jgi:D-sedoheptulose 7-phosphate isomerase